MNDAVKASPEHVGPHVNYLWERSFQELTWDFARDPTDSNTAIVRMVADMRLATENQRLADETRRLADETRGLRRVAFWAVLAALAVGVLSAVITVVNP